MSKETMRAVVMESFGPPDGLVVRDVSRPAMMPHNEVLVEVHAAGTNPFETKLRRGWFQGMFPVSPPHILGQDVAGVIVAKGFDVSGLELDVGDRVWGLLDPAKPGAYAEYVAAPSYLIRRMPANLSFAEAASVPMAGCTAWFGLADLAGVKRGDRVLVHAGAGGVGSFGIQIAKRLGAWVAATCSTDNIDYVRSLGADQVIDRTTTDFAEVLQDIDVVLDPIGGETNLKSYTVLKRGGTLLVVLRGDQMEMGNRDRLMAKYGVMTKIVAFSARPDILDSLRGAFEAGALRAPKLAILPLDQASTAHTQLETGHTHGKIVLAVRAE